MKSYLKALIILITYVIITRAIFISTVVLANSTVAFLIEIITASFSGFAWFYFFEHEDIFKFVKIIKDKKKNAEQKLLDKFLRFGSIGASVLIGYIGGPLFCALTIHLLLKDFKYKYYLLIAICASSSFLSLAMARGLLHLVFSLV